MPTAEQIKQRIEAAIPGALAEVEDYTGGGDHFRAHVTAATFEGRSRIEQHRLIYEIFGAEIGGPIHALSLKTTVPSNVKTTVSSNAESSAATSATVLSNAESSAATSATVPSNAESSATTSATVPSNAESSATTSAQTSSG